MSDTPKILAFAGSARNDSLNKKLVRVAALGAEKGGAEVTVIDLRDYPLPIYDLDLENKSGIPTECKALKALMKAHDGFLISSPEHNSTVSALLKNTIDWTSRQEEGESSLECFAGKVAGLVAASPGQLGGLRGLFHLRSILMNIGVMVIPDQVAVPKAFSAFNANGSMTDTKMQARVEKIGAVLAETTRKMKAS